jgi:hypothetical protein
MMAEYTRGPWELDESLKGEGYTAINGEGWYELATVVTRMKQRDEDSPEGLANARLIAAAPDMLAALTDAYQYMVDYKTCQNQGLLDDMQAAIAKAKEAV